MNDRPATSEPYDDLIVIMTADDADKQALVDDPGTHLFTIDHFRKFNAVLVRASRLGEISRIELAEVITEAWLRMAPKRLAKAHLDGVARAQD